MIRDPLRTLALAKALTKGEFRGLEWAVTRARRDSDAFGTRPENALSAIRRLKQHMATPSAEVDLMSVQEQLGLTWAVKRATKDSDGYGSEALAARTAVAKLHATIKFEQETRLAGQRGWAYKLEERQAAGGHVSHSAVRAASAGAGRAAAAKAGRRSPSLFFQ
ncbi:MULTISPECIES: hypothetical protein [unclassified Variovorax]|uniref:hypothetical protein n=1 Tax=unclassified Variovorax TaxID=663243 RepID=UPI00076C0CF4|nr:MULTISPECIES: hypothetical protein [unclassified Variovorax]KWT67020.1 hypothetical protein APY03_7128 [Variovorax sp. WDL1]PNG49146.1 hypothetical protein CHC06_06383 [Variovorax sp. B2]PNG49531.1 hypothetical protein CHC07_06440 [Variovorax sp. B4]VTV18828.1 hypothetical protein WDL1P2_00457 [Variovorax sp. WDL1]